MKRMLYIIGMILLLAGCSKDVELVSDVAQQGKFCISAQITDDDTRIDINGTSVKWATDYFITIAKIGEDNKFTTETTFYIDNSSISEDGKSAKFYGNPLSAGRYIAVNYYGQIITDKDTEGLAGRLMVVSTSETQVGDGDNSHLPNYWNMTTAPFEVTTDDSDAISLGFTNESSYMMLDLSLESGADPCELKKIELIAPAELFDEARFLDNNGDTVSTESTNTLTLNISGDATISATEEYRAYIPFMPNEQIKEVDGDFTLKIITTDSCASTSTFPAKLLTSGKVYTREVEFPAVVDYRERDREALIAIYNAMGGKNWENNENWCSDKPLDEWYGVKTDHEDRVSALHLPNNLIGSIPEAIGDLTSLGNLQIISEGVTGTIPASICKLTNLYALFIGSSISGEIPTNIGNLTNLEYLGISSDNITGTIPASIAKMTKLESLSIAGIGYNSEGGTGKIGGKVPDIFANMSNLRYLQLSCAQFSGELPASIGKLSNLEDLDLDYCKFEGSIGVLKDLKKLNEIDISSNNFSGAIPTEFSERDNWNKLAWDLLSTQRSGKSLTCAQDIHIEESKLKSITGEAINTKEYFAKNKVTCVVLWRSWCGWSARYMETIKEMYKDYSSKGFGLISLNDERELTTITNYVNSAEIPGHVCQIDYSYDYEEGSNRVKYMPTNSSPTYVFVDNEGKVLFNEQIFPFTGNREDATREFLATQFGKVEPPVLYESSDYSKDGEVTTLQTATVGTGIDLVVVGDGFIDKDMATDGKYEARMKEAADHFFSREPYKSLRNRFNIYMVKAVSKNETVDGVSKTVFSAEFGEGTEIKGNDATVFEYAKKVPSITDTKDISVIVALNSPKYAGTCYMYTNNASIAYCPYTDNNSEQFRQVIVHEAGGHGFAKLLDEYAYEGTISQAGKDNFLLQSTSYGWGVNVDITDDAKKIQWAHLLSDPRYNDLVGIYEGALTYARGAYRPTDESIMRYNTGEYNAPSREEIYRRIMEQSGGKFDFEEFATFDAANRSIPAATHSTRAERESFVPLGRPVIVKSK